MKHLMSVMFIVFLALVLSACGGNDNDKKANENDKKETTDPVENATDEEDVLVSLNNTAGNVVATATLTEDDAGVHIKLVGKDLPEGTHAFHIHEKGACETPDFKSAGGHYNPTDDNHGKDDPEGPHAGDFDNIEVGKDGTVDIELTTDKVTLEKGQENTLYTDDGTSLVIHAEADDYKSQPSGDAGDRIACGVIGK